MSEPAAEEPMRVACLGGSITFGLGLPDRRTQSYPSVLQGRLDARDGSGRWHVRNFGYAGATASRTTAEPYWETPTFTAASRFEPQRTLIILGTNDGQFAHADGRKTLARDLADLVDHFRDLGSEVCLGDPPPVFQPVKEIDQEALDGFVRDTIRRVAEDLTIPLLDFYAPLLDARDEFPDGLHPTVGATERLAEIAMGFFD